MKLFVYGSLQKGYAANARYLSGAKFLGKACTHGHLLDVGSFPAAILAAPTVDSYIWGELYEISQDVLPEIDFYEGFDLAKHLEDKSYCHYLRSPVATYLFTEDSVEQEHAITYVWNVEGRSANYPHIKDGTWVGHSKLRT